MRTRLALPVLGLLLAVASSSAWDAPPAESTVAGGAEGEVTSIVAGRAHTCALLEDGGLTCWGANGSGQLGAETDDECGAAPFAFPCNTAPLGVVALDGDVLAAAAGRDHTCALVVGGDLYCWGGNDSGQLGAAAPDVCGTEPFAFACSPVPLAVTGLAGDVVAVGAGEAHTCALIDGGQVQCWGENENGQLGDGSIQDSDLPVSVAGLDDAVAIAVGGFHTCAITTGGGAECWGKNGEGQLGDDRACGSDCSLPAQVAGMDSGVAAISAAVLHTCALSAGGAVTCWGINFDGQVGDGTDQNVRFEPTGVSGLAAGVLAIDANGEFTGHTCAITTPSGLVCWGDNSDGQLGDGTMLDRFVPTAIPSVGDNVTIVAAGYAHTCAARTNGVFCWGDNASGQLGYGTTASSALPVRVQLGEPIPAGDADCDAAVTSVDAALMLQLSAALLETLPCQEAADVNLDGTINAIDAALVLQVVAGLLGSL